MARPPAKLLVGGVAVLLVAVGLVLVLRPSSSGGGGADAGRPSASGAACGRVVTDRLDPRSLQHVLPGAPQPTFLTEPPTSGPHQPGALGGGVIDRPLPGAVQVGALEAGQVLLQWRDLAPADLAALQALAGPKVVVAPDPALADPVVASAWLTRQRCRAVDVAALRRFVATYVDKVTGTTTTTAR